MYDSADSVDSDEGIRYKMENVQDQQDNPSPNKKEKLFRKIEINNEYSNVDKKPVIGPVLPPELFNKQTNATETSPIIGPALPPHLTHSPIIGPTLPPQLCNLQPFSEQNKSTNVVKSNSIGPQLPPHILDNKQTASLSSTNEQSDENTSTPCPGASFGPALPPHLRNKFKSDASTKNCIQSPEDDEEISNEKTIGPSLPSHLRKQLQEQSQSQEDSVDSDSDQEMYGPVPVGTSRYSASQIALEERALQLQIDKLGPQGNDAPGRESWMIDLPEAKAANFGLGPRQFRNRAAPDMSDRSSWTDIGGAKRKRDNKEKKVDLKAEAESRELQKRDKEQELLTKKHKRKSKSLVDIHQDKLRKKEEDVGTSERKPFNRDTDLQVNKFDEAQKKAVLKKAQLLDDRFSSGKTKYL